MRVASLVATLIVGHTRQVRQILFAAGIVFSTLLVGAPVSAQRVDPHLRPDLRRALAAPAKLAGDGISTRTNGYIPAGVSKTQRTRETLSAIRRGDSNSRGDLSAPAVPRASAFGNTLATNSIRSGTPLTQVLHTSQLSLTSGAGTDEQFVDRNGDLIADDRTTFDSAGGSFDIAVGRSGVRYEVFSGTLDNTLIGVLLVAFDSNADYHIDSFIPYNLRDLFSLRSAAAVVTGTSKAGREFVIVSSSGYYNSDDPNDPNNEPSPGVVLLFLDPATGELGNARRLVHVGDNTLYNANGLALLPNNDLLIADFHSNELRIIRDSDNDGVPDTLSTTPYYSYSFSDDAPLDIAVNSGGVVFSHSAGNDMVLLALYDDNADGRADRDEVCVEGLSIDNNLLMHGLTVDGAGNVYVIEDASGLFDGSGGNGGAARIDAFPDRLQDGFLSDGSVFTGVDDQTSQGLSGLGFGGLPANKIDDPQFFVAQHYRDFLNREPDASGLAFWVNEILSCGSDTQCIENKRVNVSAAFFLSIEFQETGYLVYKFYKAAYGNLPGAPVPVRFNELVPDTQQIGQQVIVGVGDWALKLENNKKTFADQFGARSSLATVLPTSLTPPQFVDALYQNSEVRSPPASERTAAINEFGGAANTADTAARGRALRRVAENATLGQQEFRRAFVLMQYFGYLRRNPNDPPDTDYADYNFWLDKLNDFDGNFVNAEMVKAFLVSIEYRQRFGP